MNTFDRVILGNIFAACLVILFKVSTVELQCPREVPVEKTVTPYVEKTT